MKKNLPILLTLLFAGCATTSDRDPLAGISPDRVSSIQVGTFKVGAAEQPEFQQYFLIDNPSTVRKLTSLLATSDRIDPYLPGIGGLSWQRFLNEKGDPIAVTCIVNYGSRITINKPSETHGDYYVLTYSEPYCRTIYDLMVQHCPHEVEKLDKQYRKVGHTIEGLLFQNKKEEAKGTTNPATE